MRFGKVEARDRLSVFAAGAGLARARTEPAAALRRHRGFAHAGCGADCGPEAGFTYIGLLVLIAMMGVALVLVSELWQTAQQREKEQELLFIGNQFRRAIAMYSADGGGYPHKLEDMLKDPRFPGVRRTLRKIYRDPITGGVEWGLVKLDGNSIAGVYSLSNAEPLKQSGFNLADQSFEAKKKYSEWVFGPSATQGSAGARVPLAQQETAALPAPTPVQDAGASTASPAAQESGGAATPSAPGSAASAATPVNSGTTPVDEGQSGSLRLGPRGRR
jgi:type II secretory pathway pseudopilin PulG